MTIKAILFDLDDTLLWDERSVKEAFLATCQEAVNHYSSISPERLEAAVRYEARQLYESYETFPFTKQIGINPFEGLWANFTGGEQEEFRQLEKLAPGYRRDAWTRGLESLGIKDTALGERLAEQFPRERRKRPILYDETFVTLDGLRGKYSLLLLTNGSPDLQKEKLAGVPELASYFDTIIISGEFGIGKPSETIFNHAMDKLGIKADEGLMVGDKLTTDILGSNKIHMPNVWVNRHRSERNDDIIPRFEISSLLELQAIIDQL